MAKKVKVYPGREFQRSMLDKGLPITLLWDVPGPKDTLVYWISCYQIGGEIFLVETHGEGRELVFKPLEYYYNDGDEIVFKPSEYYYNDGNVVVV